MEIKDAEGLTQSIRKKFGMHADESTVLSAFANNPTKYMDEVTYIAKYGLVDEEGNKGEFIEECMPHWINKNGAFAFMLSVTYAKHHCLGSDYKESGYFTTFLQDSMKFGVNKKKSKDVQEQIIKYMNFCVRNGIDFNQKNGVLMRATTGHLYKDVVKAMVKLHKIPHNERIDIVLERLIANKAWDLAEDFIRMGAKLYMNNAHLDSYLVEDEELLKDDHISFCARYVKSVIDEKAKELASVAPAQTFIVDPKTFSMKRKNSTLPPLTNR